MAQPVTDDEIWQRKQARRRLVGAIVLVLLVVVFLPWVLDDKPKPLTKNVDIQIPAIDPPEKKFGTPAPTTPVAPVPEPVPTPSTASPGPAPETSMAPSATGATPSTPAPSTPSEAKVELPVAGAAAPEVKPETSTSMVDTPVPPVNTEPAAEESKKKPANAEKPAAKKPVADSGRRFIVPLGTFSKEDNARRLVSRVRAEGLPVVMEKFRSDGGQQIRVRLGPFSSELSAERARRVVVQKGIAPGPTKVIAIE